ncbi:MAG: DNA translocase FtsK [Bacteriovoracales bacterium]|nr:DNA translocase FtsK [Bacteriovoracales bacterium]
MRERILKIEIIFLFSLCLLSTLCFYFQETLPDHFLSISSEHSDINFLTYGLTSALVGIEYFSGIWLVFPCIFFFMIYGLFFTERTHRLDTVLILPLFSFFLMLAHLFFPVMLGQGLSTLIQSHIPWPYPWALLILSLALILFGCFRASLFKQIHSLWIKLGPPPSSAPKSSLSESHHTIRQFGKLLFHRPKKAPVQSPGANQIQKENQENEGQGQEEKREREPMGPSPIAKRSPFKRIDYLTPKELAACLFDKDDESEIGPREEYFHELTEKIEDKLSEFNVDAKIIHILKGPVVDTFELELGEGVRVAKVTSLSEDLSLALSGSPLRIIYPMEGKTTVGVEVPRNPRKTIFLYELLGSKEFQQGYQNIPLAMGKNSFGDPCIVDLTKMPHMLVAGATGAGKSVFINTLLLSILVKMPPEKLKLILIDPKQLELSLYASLPHLVMPVITDPSRAVASLMWAVDEMERRYTLLSKLGVRSIDAFNKKVKEVSSETLSTIADLYEGMENTGYELPYLVIIIDEFADLVLVKNGKAIESYICRLAAKARACGIHLVIATQRPSVDVITGLIKANFPTRISFRVSAGQDSRTILNTIGAEKLLGKGDMLYKHGIEMRRLHAAFVNEDKICELIDKISTDNPPFLTKAINYLNSKTSPQEEKASNVSVPQDGTSDPLYKKALQMVFEHRLASASLIQRRFKIGYNRAANLIEAMETNGVVGPSQGAKPREVLLESLEDFEPSEQKREKGNVHPSQ